MKILFLTNIPSPYRVDFFNELGKTCKLTVLFERNDANHRNHEWLQKKNEFYHAIFLKGKKIGSDSAINFDVLKYLDKRKFDIIVVGGYSTPTGMIAISYLKLKGIPFILNADGGFIKENENTIKRSIKKYFISSANFWFSSGKTTTNCLRYYGARLDYIYKFPLTSILEKDIIETPVEIDVKKKIKEMININEEKVILTVGQFIHRKGFNVLIKSCIKLPKEYGIYIIGGEPTQEYIDLKNKLELNNVHFVGFKSKEELKKYYMASDIFVLPTREDIWGLVINEAMAYGLPVITTDKCIAGLELVKDYENGFIVPVDNEKQLAEKINIVLSDERLCRSMAEKSLEKIREYTIEKMAERHMEIFGKIEEAFYGGN